MRNLPAIPDGMPEMPTDVPIAAVRVMKRVVNGMGNVHLILTSGRTISILRDEYSYGGPAGLFEVAYWDDDSSAFMSDPKGWLTAGEVVAYVRELATPVAIEGAS